MIVSRTDILTYWRNLSDNNCGETFRRLATSRAFSPFVAFA